MSNTYKFSTNINCGGCVASVKPVLDEVKGIDSWEVDTEHPSKILTVTTNQLSEKEVIELVKSAGFTAKPNKKGIFGGLLGK